MTFIYEKYANMHKKICNYVRYQVDIVLIVKCNI